MDILKDMLERIEQGTRKYIHDRITKSIGDGAPCHKCQGETVAYPAFDECPKCNTLTIRMRR